MGSTWMITAASNLRVEKEGLCAAMVRRITFGQKEILKNQNRTKKNFMVETVSEQDFAFQME